MSSKSTQVPAATSTSTPFKKRRNTRDYGNYKSKEGTPTITEVSEKDLIAEGARYPYLRKISFQKTAKERAQLKRVHSSKKGPSQGVPPAKSNGLPAMLIVHIKNKPSKKDFKTTYSFSVKSNEIDQVLNTFFHIRDENTASREYITKCYYNGKPYNVKQLGE